MRSRAIHIEVQQWLFKHLVNVDVHGSGDKLDSVGNLLGQLIILLHAAPRELDINRRGHTEVQNLTDNVGRLKEELSPGE